MRETQLYMQDVHRAFDGYKAINGLSIAIARGELRAVVGPNGAGKTTMLDIITGKTRPDSGEVIWGADTDLTRLDEALSARLGIGRKFQKPTVFETHTVEDNLMLALAGDRGVKASLFFRISRSQKARIDELLELVPRLEVVGLHGIATGDRRQCRVIRRGGKAGGDQIGRAAQGAAHLATGAQST